jgi:hypothetical protein
VHSAEPQDEQEAARRGGRPTMVYDFAGPGLNLFSHRPAARASGARAEPPESVFRDLHPVGDWAEELVEDSAAV